MNKKIKTNEIDWSAVDAEFFNQNLNKIDITQFRNRYNDWLNVIYILAQLGVDKNVAKDWCKSDPSEYDEKQFEANWKVGLSKSDGFEKAARGFAQFAGIQLPQTEAKSFEEKITQIVDSNKIVQSQAQKEVNLEVLKLRLEIVNPKKLTVKLTKTTKDLAYWFGNTTGLIWCGNEAAFDPTLVRNFKDICEITSDKYSRNCNEFQFLCINPVDVNEKNQLSRSDSCVTEYKHMLLEFDNMDIDFQKRFWSDLIDSGLPVKSLVYSGGKSIHCLLKVQNISSKEEYEDYFQKIAEVIEQNIGVTIDKKCKNPTRLSRFPNGRRDNGAIQDVLYIDPSPEVLNDSVTVLKDYFKDKGCQNKAANANKVSIDEIDSTEILYFMDRNIVKDIWTDGTKIYAKVKNFTGDTPWIIDCFGQSTKNLIKAYFRFLDPQFSGVFTDVKTAIKLLEDAVVQYKQIGFEPCLKSQIHVKAKTVNTFVPGYLGDIINDPTIPAELNPELEALIDNVFGDNIKERDWLFQWMRNYMHNFKKMLTAPVLLGPKGIGKSMIAQAFACCIGSWQAVKQAQIEDAKFNAWVKSAVIILDEVTVGSKKDGKAFGDQLKSYITQLKQTVEFKGKDISSDTQISINNCWIITANHTSGSPVPPLFLEEGERRYTIIKNPKAKILSEYNSEFFNSRNLEKYWDNGYGIWAKQLFKYIYNLPEDKSIDVNKGIKNEVFSELVEDSKTSLQKLVEQFIAEIQSPEFLNMLDEPKHFQKSGFITNEYVKNFIVSEGFPERYFHQMKSILEKRYKFELNQLANCYIENSKIRKQKRGMKVPDELLGKHILDL